ncbi:TonB-dependent receptor [Undibacterium sp. Jales W-56]|uniref:TonB-dependent receptor plug domain-containing protein n=1 Tax=Undibacterium sp. Jales W-56 TaxID=2897325 RepID=UPI0021D084D8|nr:TonB-dependent receptor [Undibacterium sp. Jales W-56]MCU6434910.1 TonB-dependent receptor [Undibacterium sp. Jales W-56]
MIKEKILSRSVRIMFSSGIAMGLGIIAQPVLAQDAVQRIEITGSSIKRVESETALPVTVMKREDIERTGATTAQDLVNLIPGNFGGGVVANNVGATGNPSTANLRSLGSKYTLVLLNGRRVANYAIGNSPVDLNSIPLSAIERIEVLRDGASAVYGADAIAGVINFILKKDYQGLEASVYGTKVVQKGGDTRSFNVTGGYGDLNKQGFNILLSANHENDDVLKARDRSFAATANRPDLGINKASPRNGVPNFNFTDSLGNKYTGVNPYRFNGCNNTEFSLVIRNEKACGTDYVKYIDLIPKQTHDNFVARAVFKINDDHEVFAEAAHTKDNTLATYSPAPYTINMTYPTGGKFYPTSFTIPKGYVVPSGTTYKLANGSTLAAGSVLANDVVVTPVGPMSGTWRTVAGGGRQDNTDATNDRFLVGSKGVIAGWDYETALTYAKNKVEITFGEGQFSYAKLTPLVRSGAINVFGSQDATSLAALRTALLTGQLENNGTSISKEFDFRISKEIAQTSYGPVGLALGTSYRQESLDQFSAPVLASGDQVGGAGPIPGVTGDRKVLGLFAESNIPLYKDLEADIAARYDSYKNGFGTSFNKLSPKIGFTYKPTKTLLARASYGVGFRAPTLYENLRPFTTGNNTNSNFSDPVRCPNGVPVNSVNPVGAIQDECNVQLPTANSGNTDVKPEKSKQYSLGLVFQPTASFSGSIDYWNIRINDAILSVSENTVFGNPAANVNNFYRYDPALFPDGWVDDGKQTGAIKGSTNKDFPLAYVNLPLVNAGAYFAAGIDLNLNYKAKVENVGNFTMNFDSTYYTKHGYQYQGSPEVSDAGTYKDLGPTPRWRHALTVTYNRGPWSASVTQNYTSGYHDFTDPEAVGANYPADRSVSPYETYDATLGWKGIKNVDLSFGIKNLLDRDPPSSRTAANFQTGYDASFTNPLGRVYYVRAKYKFW